MTQPGAHAARVAVIHNASTRLGRALAKELALQGFSLALCSANPASLESVVDETFNLVEVSPFKVSAYECDIRNKRSVDTCAREIFEDYSRVDVVCILENRNDEFDAFNMETSDDVSFDNNSVPVLSSRGEALHSLNVNVSDVRNLLNAFYPLLKHPKPEAPPLRFFEVIPPGARRLLRPGESDDTLRENNTDEEEKSATSLLLYVTTPDAIFCRAGRSAISTRVRTIEAILEGLNAEAVARDEPIRMCTAIVGTLDGEIPFWRFDSERFLYEAKQAEEAWKRFKQQEGDEQSKSQRNSRKVRFQETDSDTKQERRAAGSFDQVIQSILPSGLLRSRRASRSRIPKDLQSNQSMASVVDVSDEEGYDDNKSVISAPIQASEQGYYEERDDDGDEDMIPPPSPVHRRFNFEPERLTAESLSHTEACAWITWGLARGRNRIIIGYDLLLLQSAWVPSAVLRGLFSFSAHGSPNLLPIRPKDSYMPTTESAKRAQAQYDAGRLRRQQAREIVLLLIIVFALFPPGLALGLLFLLFITHRIATSSEGHRATERAVAITLYLVAVRRWRLVRNAWEVFRTVERRIFGSISTLHVRLEEKLKGIARKSHKV